MKANTTKIQSHSQRRLHSNKSTIYLWLSLIFSAIPLAFLIRQPAKNNFPSEKINTVANLLGEGEFVSSLDFQFSHLMPLVLCNLFAYQPNSPLIAWLAGYSLFLAGATAESRAPRVIEPEFLVNSNITGDQFTPSMARLSSGKWSIVWIDLRDNNYHVYGKIYDNSGGIVTPDFQISIDTKKTRHNPTITSLASGNQWVAVWDADINSTAGVFARRYTTTADALDNQEFRLDMMSQNYNFQPVLTELTSGDWVASWITNTNSQYGVYTRRYQMSAAISAAFQVNTVSRTMGGISHITTAALPSGGWVAAWMGDFDIYARVYSANNNAFGPEFLINTNTSREQTHPTIGSFTNGGWVIAWMSAQDLHWDIYAKLYGPNNLPIGPEFIVSANNTRSQGNPRICVLSPTTWAIAWESDHTKINNEDIYVKIYDINGTAISDDYRANALSTTGYQTNPSIIGLNDYDIVVSWMSGDSPSSEHDILATILSFAPTQAPTPQASTNPTFAPTQRPSSTSEVTPTQETVTTQSNSVDTAIKTVSDDTFTTTTLLSLLTTQTKPATTTRLATNMEATIESGANQNEKSSDNTLGIALGVTGGLLLACGLVGYYGFWKNKRKVSKQPIIRVYQDIPSQQNVRSEYDKIYLKDDNQPDGTIPSAPGIHHANQFAPNQEHYADMPMAPSP